MSDEKEILDMVVDREYKHGFNAGYLLAKHDPEKLKVILKDEKNQTPFVLGIHAGRKEYEKERLMAQLGEDRNNDKDRDMGR